MSCPLSLLDVSYGIETFPVSCEDNCILKPPKSFQYVKTNIPGPGCNIDEFSAQFKGCSCPTVCTIDQCFCLKHFGQVYDADGKITNGGFEELSTKPVLECGNDCSCDRDLCINRVVQKGISNSLHVFFSQEKGYGLKIAESNGKPVSFGSFVCEYAGEVVGHDEARRRVKYRESIKQDNYLIALKEYVSERETCIYIDPCLFGNVGRFINHSCQPNLIMVPVRVNHHIPRLALFARREIMPGEELTFDYSGKASWNLSDLHCSKDMTMTKGKHLNNPGPNSLKCIQAENEHNTGCETDFSSPSKKVKLTASECSSDSLCLKASNRCLTIDNCNFQGMDTAKSVKPTELSCDQSTVNYQINSTFESINSKESVHNIKRKHCFCKSSNCTGFLPYDINLLNDPHIRQTVSE